MPSLHPKQQKILDHLLENPSGATLEDLASHLGITKTAVKDHLLKIDAFGYLTFEDSQGRVGRPRRRYMLSETGHDAFPKQYSWLSNALLQILAEDMGRAGIEKLMRSMADQVADSMAEEFQGAKNPREVLTKLTQKLKDLGYRAALKQSDLRKGAVIEATNCVYHSVAQRHPGLCGFDVRLIENISGMNVKLETCIARGGNVCRFCLNKRPG